jgi:hypothetical protein
VTRGLRNRLSYANIIATLALFLALGGTSYAVLRVGSRDVVDNTLRSRDIHDNTVRSRDIRNRAIRAQDVRRAALGGQVINESSLDTVPTAANAGRVGGATAQDLRVKCPGGTLSKAGLCIETSARPPTGFVSAVAACSNEGRGLVTMPQLDDFIRSRGGLAQPEWTASVYRDRDDTLTPTEQLEAVVLAGNAAVQYDKVHAVIQHAFRCAALPSN